MATTDLSHLSLDSSADFKQNTNHGLRERCLAVALTQVLDGLMVSSLLMDRTREVSSRAGKVEGWSRGDYCFKALS